MGRNNLECLTSVADIQSVPSADQMTTVELGVCDSVCSWTPSLLSHKDSFDESLIPAVLPLPQKLSLRHLMARTSTDNLECVQVEEYPL